MSDRPGRPDDRRFELVDRCDHFPDALQGLLHLTDDPTVTRDIETIIRLIDRHALRIYRTPSQEDPSEDPSYSFAKLSPPAEEMARYYQAMSDWYNQEADNLIDLMENTSG
jgi:hypothetical protein